MTARVAVVIPTFNRADLLPQAIDSVLAQTVGDVDIVVVDDASTDDTAAVIARYSAEPRVRYLANERNMGISASRNRGIESSSAPYVAMLDSDDVWLDPAKLAAQLDAMERMPDCALVGTDATVIDRSGRVVGAIRNCTGNRAIHATMFVKNQFVTSSVLVRRSILDDVGLFDLVIPIGEDYELWLRIARRHRVANLRGRMTGYRIHDGNVSRRNHQAFIDAFRMVHAAYGRSFPLAWVLRIRMWREWRALARQVRSAPAAAPGR